MKRKFTEITKKIQDVIPDSNEGLMDMSLIMTLLMLLYITNDLPYYNIFIPLLLVPGILFKEIRFRYYLWLVLLLYFSWFYVFLGTSRYVPNHKYLYVLLLLLVTLILYFKDSTDSLFAIFRIAARYIIGFIFLFATIGKFLAPEFLDGSFFKFTLLTDPRFFGFTELIGGVNKAEIWRVYDQFEQIKTTSHAMTSVSLPGTNRLTILSLFLTYWTILIEGAIALTFLAKENSWLGKVRNWVLLIFIITTYPIATVPGFAVLLALLGFISVSKTKNVGAWRLVFLLAFILVPIFKIPFVRILEVIIQ